MNDTEESVLKKRKISNDESTPSKTESPQRETSRKTPFVSQEIEGKKPSQLPPPPKEPPPKKKKKVTKKKKRKRKKFKPPFAKKKVVKKVFENEIVYLQEKIKELESEIERTEKPVMSNANKHKADDDRINELIERWKSAIEDCIYELQKDFCKTVKPNITILEILKGFRVNPEMITYDDEDDEFLFFKKIER